jgi:predicted secreted Zn-dependent protease
MLALSCATLAGLQSAAAAPRISSDTVYYNVRGTTAQGLLAYMLRHGPGGESGRALGTTSARITQDTDFNGAERCRLQNYRLELEMTIRLPRLEQGQQLSRTLRRRWTNFVNYVTRHENRHKSIYANCVRRIERRVRALNGTMSCRALRSQMQSIFNEENSRCDGEHRAFDAGEASRIQQLPLIVHAATPAQQHQNDTQQAREQQSTPSQWSQNRMTAMELR